MLVFALFLSLFAHGKNVDEGKLLQNLGLSKSNVKIEKVRGNAEDAVNVPHVTLLNIRILKTSKFMGNSLPAGSSISYQSDLGVTDISTASGLFKVDGVSCHDEILLIKGHLCHCQLAKKYSRNGIELPEGSKVAFKDGALAWFFVPRADERKPKVEYKVKGVDVSSGKQFAVEKDRVVPVKESYDYTVFCGIPE